MTKYELKGHDIYLHKRVRKDEMSWAKWEDTKIGKIKDIDPIFRHPITAIAYSVDGYSWSNIKSTNILWDKKDIIKAIDFWIADKVLENERILLLEGNLKDVEEIELKNLIRMRNAVRDLPTNAKFTKNCYNHKIRSLRHFSTWLVEFYHCEEKKVVTQNLDIKYSMEGILANLANSISGDNYHLPDEVSLHLGGGNHSGTGWTTINNRSGEHLDDISRILSRIGAGTNTTPPSSTDPNNWIITRVNGTSGNTFYRVTGPGGRPIIASFAHMQEAQRHITTHIEQHNNSQPRWIRENEFDPSSWMVVPDPTSVGGFKIVNSNGINLAVGFHTLAEARNFALEHSRRILIASHTEEQHPSIDTGSSPYVLIKDYQQVRLSTIQGDEFVANSNSYQRVCLTFHNSQYEVELNLYINRREFEEIRALGNVWLTLNIRLYNRDGHIERATINDHNYYCLGYTENRLSH
jgi:hypothetical protein